MDLNKAVEVSKLVAKIDKCKEFISSLEDRSYDDEFTIHYRGMETCELEAPVLEIIIDYYKRELKDAEEQLAKL